MSEIAQRYAQALYAVMQDEQLVCESARELMGEPQLWQALISPAISPKEKCAVLDCLEGQEMPKTLLHFYQVLARKGRLALLPEIVGAFHALVLKEHNIAPCVMYCVHAPSQEQQERIKEMLCRLHRRDGVELRIVLDPALLGGFILQIEGVTYDKSVRGQLKTMARQLRERRLV